LPALKFKGHLPSPVEVVLGFVVLPWSCFTWKWCKQMPKLEDLVWCSGIAAYGGVKCLSTGCVDCGAAIADLLVLVTKQFSKEDLIAAEYGSALAKGI